MHCDLLDRQDEKNKRQGNSRNDGRKFQFSKRVVGRSLHLFLTAYIKTMTRLRILDAFSPDVPLGVRTLRKRLHAKHGPVVAAVHEQISVGRLRRVQPSEVGSGKYSAASPPRWDLNQLRGTRKRRAFRQRQMDVFVLV